MHAGEVSNLPALPAIQALLAAGRRGLPARSVGLDLRTGRFAHRAAESQRRRRQRSHQAPAPARRPGLRRLTLVRTARGGDLEQQRTHRIFHYLPPPVC